MDTGKFTGRSPKDKWIVKQAPSEENLWWGSVNQPMKGEVFEELYKKCVAHYNGLDKAYVFDGYCGANPASRKKVRFLTEQAWQQHFVTNMFIRPESKGEIEGFAPDFTIINACRVVDEDWKKHGLNSEVFVAFNIEKRVAIIGGTHYGGEMKKGIFSMMNYWLPLEGIMPMHCSANKGKEGDTALFFGLSGTGKTTLSADPARYLIGDDEHGWDDHGIFNFEGGCYAKTINLSEENEPDIYRAIKRDAMLENCYIDPKTKVPDYYNTTKTENGRVSYPLHHIANFEPTSMGGHPDKVIFLTCDAFGVLPPVAKLSPGQAMYHFLSGYTAKVAGTERGITEPQATFSACFGAAFLTLHPTKYADLLQKKLETHGTVRFGFCFPSLPPSLPPFLVLFFVLCLSCLPSLPPSFGVSCCARTQAPKASLTPSSLPPLPPSSLPSLGHLPGEHRLDRRRIWRGQAHVDQEHPHVHQCHFGWLDQVGDFY